MSECVSVFECVCECVWKVRERKKKRKRERKGPPTISRTEEILGLVRVEQNSSFPKKNGKCKISWITMVMQQHKAIELFGGFQKLILFHRIVWSSAPRDYRVRFREQQKQKQKQKQKRNSPQNLFKSQSFGWKFKNTSCSQLKIHAENFNFD